jgi:hypothetical protein
MKKIKKWSSLSLTECFWKLFFRFPKKEMDSQRAHSFSVQTLLVRCGFQSPATQLKLFNISVNREVIKTSNFRS